MKYLQLFVSENINRSHDVRTILLSSSYGQRYQRTTIKREEKTDN